MLGPNIWDIFDLFTFQNGFLHGSNRYIHKKLSQGVAKSFCTFLHQSVAYMLICKLPAANSSVVCILHKIWNVWLLREAHAGILAKKQHSGIFRVISCIWTKLPNPLKIDSTWMGKTALKQLRTFHLASFQCASRHNCILHRIERVQKISPPHWSRAQKIKLRLAFFFLSGYWPIQTWLTVAKYHSICDSLLWRLLKK